MDEEDNGLRGIKEVQLFSHDNKTHSFWTDFYSYVKCVVCLFLKSHHYYPFSNIYFSLWILTEFCVLASW